MKHFHPVAPFRRSLALLTIILCLTALAVVYVSRSSAQNPKVTPAKTRAEQLYGPFDYAEFLEREKNGEFPSQAGPVPPVSPYNSLTNNNGSSSATGNFTQSETTLTAFGNTVIVGFNDSGSVAGGSNKFTGWARSTDGGVTFTDGGTLPTNPNGDAGDPVLARNETTGRIFFATLQYDNSGIDLFHSDDNGQTWSAPAQAAPGKTGFQDKEWIAVDNFAGPGNGNVYHVVRDFGAGDGIYFFRSTDHGATFAPSGGTAIVTGTSQGAFVAVGTDHAVYAFWYGVDAIHVRKSTDFGLTFGPTVNIATGLVGAVNGDLGLTGIRNGLASASAFRTNAFPHAVVNPVNGHIYVTHGADGAGADKADVFLRQSTDGGATWSAAIKVNDDATTTDQWQPTLAVTPDGQNLGIFYYSRQEDPVGNNLFKFYGRNATISGATITFKASYAISDVASLPEFGRDINVNTVYMGDYDHAVGTTGAFHVVWADNRADLPGGGTRKDPNVYYKKINLTLHVTTTNPGVSSVISTQPTVFTIDVSEPVNAATVQASDLTVNGIPATSVAYTPGSATMQFTFAATPVTAQGQQTMNIAAGAFTSEAAGDAVAEFIGTFRFDVLLLQVISTVPSTGGVFNFGSPATYDVSFNEPIDPASVQTSDLQLSGIAGSTVTGVTVLPGNTTARFTLNFPSEGPITASIGAGAITDVFGNIGAPFTGNYIVDIATISYPTPLLAKLPTGSLIYDPSISANIGFAGDTDSFTLIVDARQTITAIVTSAAGLQSSVQLFDPSNAAIGVATAAAAGHVAVLQTAAAVTAGVYRFTVSGSAGTTGNYTLQVILNTARELEGLVAGATNNTIATAQDITGSFINLQTSLTSAQRGAVNGVTDSVNYTASAAAFAFEDISATGTVIAGLTNQDEKSVSIPIGLNFPFYGSTYASVFVSSNGLLTFGSANSSFSNSNLTTTPSQAAISPFWDDQDTNGGLPGSNVFYKVTGAGSDEHLTIQWNQVKFFAVSVADTITYQAQLYVDGRIKFNYLDLVTGTNLSNNGRFATVGIKDVGSQGPGRLLLSFNEGPNAFVGTGLSTLLTPPNPLSDYYSFPLAVGEVTTLVVKGLSFDAAQVELLNSGGGVVASGVAGATNVDHAISNFAVPTNGTYYARVTSPASTPYNLVVTRNAAFDTEVNNTQATAQSLNGAKGVLGSIDKNGAYTAAAVTPAFDNISGTGTIIEGLTSQDDASVSIPIGFSFPLYAASHTSVFVNSNGLLTFGTSNNEWTNTDLTAVPSQDAIAPFWDDQHVAGGNVFYEVSGVGSDQHLTIQWNQVEFRLATPGDTLTYQVQLYADGRIKFNYLDLVAAASAGNQGALATVGIKGAGNQGANRLLLAFNNGPNTYVGTGLSTLITPAPVDDWYSITVGSSPGLLKFETSTPADGPGEFVNVLNPHIELYNSASVLVATGVTLGDGRNESIFGNALPAGTYSLRVSSETETRGEYFVSVITGGCPTITTATLPAGTPGVPYSQQIGVTPVGAPPIAYQFAVVAGSLPAGFSLNPTTGVISGTMAHPFTTTFKVRVTHPSGCYVEQEYTLAFVCPTVTVNPAALPNGAVGANYNQTITASPAATYSFTVTGGTLPPGLILAPNGSLTGAPTGGGTFNFQVTASAFGCTGVRSYQITIPCPVLSMSPASLPNGTLGTAYSQTITAAPVSTYTYAVTGGLLPNGLTLSPTGALTGTPTQSGPFSFQVTATGFGACTVIREYQISIACPVITLGPSIGPNATLGSAYSQAVSASPAGVYSYSVSVGGLPTGVTLNAATGALTGTPNAPGTFTFTISATSGDCTGSRSYTVVVACSVTITTTTLPPGTADTNYSQTIGVSPAGSFTFSLAQGNLPSGMTLNPSTGLLSGPPGAPGVYNFIVKAQSPNGCSATQALSLTINCPTIVLTPPTLPNGQIGTPYSQTIVASPAAAYSFTVSGSLPPGLALNALTGLLSGTPTANGTFSFTVTGSRTYGCSGSKAYSITIVAGACPTITLPALTGGMVGKLYMKYATASPVGFYSYSLTGNLPPGVTFYSSNGMLFGYPTTIGNYNFSITATDVNNCTGVRNYAVAITP